MDDTYGLLGGFGPDPKELERAKYMALIRSGLGMVGGEKLGSAVQGGVNTYFAGDEAARRNAALKMQEARAALQMQMALKKQQQEEQDALRKAVFIKSIPDEQLRAYGIPDPLIAGFKQAEKPEEYLKALDQFKSYTMSANQVRFNAAGGVQNQLPSDAGAVTDFDVSGQPSGRRLLPGSVEAANAIALATERGKRQAETETSLRTVPVAGGKPGETEDVVVARLLQEQGAGNAGSYAGVTQASPKVPTQAQVVNDVRRMTILQKELEDAQASGNKTNIAAIKQEIDAINRGPGAANGKRISRPRPPEGYQDKPEGGLEPVPGGPKDTSAKDLARIKSAITKADMVMSRAAETKGDVGYTTAGLGGSLSSWIPGLPAYDLKKKIDMLKANIGFQELNAMRQESPTGGALGQVAIQELDMLQSTLGSLDANQSPDELRKNLELVETHYANLKRELQKQGTKINRGGTGDWTPSVSEMEAEAKRRGLIK